MATIFLTHPPDALKNYYGERAVASLKALGEVRFNSAGCELSTQELTEAARGCELIISYRQTPGEAELFRNSPELVAFSRCAIDIRNVDVAVASEMGILVTQASAGFVASVAEWVVGAMVDLGRGISAASAVFHAGEVPVAAMGRQLRGATLGVIGYGRIDVISANSVSPWACACWYAIRMRGSSTRRWYGSTCPSCSHSPISSSALRSPPKRART
jgi:D-3-phosphoglycerate dehydrogenase